jgi:tRNA A-37 threonylcarbamoyl transferase component Bud32
MLNPQDDLRKTLLDICQNIAGKRRIVAACLYGPLASGYADEKSSLNVLLVLNSFQPMVRTYHKTRGQKDTYILTVDQRAFQRDVQMGWLGEFVADKLMVPYEPLVNAEFLWRQEAAVKRRIILELLETIIFEFPELSQELLIKPEYFMFETLMKRARLFPPVTYSYLNILRNDLKESNIEKIMRGYRQAIGELVQKNWLEKTDGHLKITSRLIRVVKSRKVHIPVVLKSVQRMAWLHLISALPKTMNPLAYDEQLYNQTQGAALTNEDLPAKLENPQCYLLMPTPFGSVPLSDTTDIEEFVKKAVPDLRVSRIETKQIGGVLNSVYLFTLNKNHEQQKVVVKKFKDWVGFKWFPLALWSLGTKSFAVLGRSRLEREYAINQYLYCHGISVPKIVHVSPKQSLVFQEFVEGENLVDIIKSLTMEKKDISEKELVIVKAVGRLIAETHKLNVVLGDCKPENIIVTKEGKPCFVDLEQASRNGDQTWDIAEFLYYIGHYIPPLASAEAVEELAKAFLEGYLEAGGKRETVRKAASPKYTKVFSIFTQPHVMLALSNLCRKTGGQQNVKNRSFTFNTVLERAKRSWANRGSHSTAD